MRVLLSADIVVDSSPRLSSVRKLPPTPATSIATTPIASFSMPEPEPYFDPSTRPSHYSTDSHHSARSSNSLRKQPTPSATIGGRRLPITPAQTHGISYTRSPLPSDFPGSHHTLPSSSHVNAPYPPEKALYHGNGSHSSGHSPSASRTSYDPGIDPTSPRANVYNVDERRAVDNGYHCSQSQPTVPQEYSPYNRNSSQSLGVSQTSYRAQSPDYITPQAGLSPTQIDSLNPCECLSTFPFVNGSARSQVVTPD